MTPAERTALDRFAAVSQDRARRLRLLAEADDALTAHLLRYPEGDAAELLVWQRQYAGLVQESDRAGGALVAASTTTREAWAAWERAFAEGA